VTPLGSIMIALAVTLALYVAVVVALVVAGRRSDARALATFVPDCAILMKRLLADPRVSGWRRAAVVGLVAYLAMPIDLVPDFIPVAGQLDDAIVVGLVLRLILRSGGKDLLREHWPGPDESFNVVNRLAYGRSAHSIAPS
jgi:uncharacterized membrane protein YkvA (DUF1232 family)